MSEILSIEYHSGQPIQYHGRQLTLFSRVVSFRIPGGDFRITWNKPTSLLVSDSGGSEQVLPFSDRTGRFPVYMLAAVLLYGMLYLWIPRRR